MKNTLILSLIISIFLIACSSGSYEEAAIATDYYEKETGSNTQTVEEAPYEDETIEPQPEQTKNRNTNENGNKTTDEKFPRKLIKIGSMTYQVEDFNEARNEIETVTKKWGGYISNETSGSTNYRISGQITIRVPSENFDSLMTEVATGAKRLESKSIEVLDVSEDYYDTKTRLETKRKVEQRYIDLLEEARTIDEILKVEQQLRIIREEIESKEGHLRLLKDRIGYSTLNISYYEVLDYTYIPEDQPNFWQRLLKGLDWGWTGFLNFLIGFFTLWPLWIVVTIAAVLIVKRIKKRRAKRSEQ